MHIKQTFYSEYFNDNVENIDLLSKEESKSIWELNIDKTSNNFFRLKDDSPIILNSENIGNWRNYYDIDDSLGLQRFLTTSFDWSKIDEIFFCINKENIIKTNYKTFLNS